MLINGIAGVIFDLDKTLVSSSLNFKNIKADVGCPEDSSILDYIDKLPAEQQANVTGKVIEFEIADAQESYQLPGASTLLDLLVTLDIPYAIVTRNCRDAALMKLQKNNISSSLLITREDHLAKPAPDALLHIAAKWKITPEKILCVGDYIYDLEAANNANMHACLVTNGEQVEFEHLANMVVNDLNELANYIQSGRIDDRVL
ncbi:HAD family hydrolase [Psychromonas sp. PT13]|uniref:HAD family hydrolase n=1 Tax=Psychromonas sp. PT13 TaxID=3439547 RepID=UPI003EBEE528